MSNQNNNTTRSNLEDTISTLQEIIRSQQTLNNIPIHEPTSTEYFAIIITTISVGKGGDNLPELLKILIGVIPNTSKNIVRLQFKNVSHSLLNILKTNQDNEVIISTTLSALGALILEQDCSDGFWDSMVALQSINAILTYTDSDLLKYRKITHDIIIRLLKKHQQNKKNGLRTYICDFCIGVILNCSRAAYKRSHYIILLLENIIAFAPENKLLPLLDCSLRLQVCEIPKLTAAVYRMLDALFQSPYYIMFPSNHQQAEQVSKQVLELLLQAKPTTPDMEANTYYCTALASGLICVRKINKSLTVDLLNPIIVELVSMADSEFIQVHCAASTAIKRVLCTIFARAIIRVTKSKENDLINSSEESELQGILESVTRIFQLKYQRSWLYMLDAIRSLFELFKTNNRPCRQLSPVIQAVAHVYQAVEVGTVTIDTVVHIGLGKTLGTALQACGLKLFLEIIPLVTENYLSSPSSNDSELITVNREWIINLLHSNLKYMPCLLADFGNCILPIASQYNLQFKSLTIPGSEVKLLRTRVTQLWSLLPEMCYFNTKDIVESFPRLSPVLERLFTEQDYPELTSYAVASLYHLAKGVRQRCPRNTSTTVQKDSDEFTTSELIALRSTAFKFLPLVLQYIENISIADTKFQEGLQCISAWCEIAPSSLVSAISKKLLQLVLTTTAMDGKENNAAAGWMAVMLAIIPLLQPSLVQLLFRSIRPLLTASETSSVQKRAYGLLFSLLNTTPSHQEIIFQLEDAMQILRAISEALLTCHVSSRTLRFRCLESLLKGLTMNQLKEALDLIAHEVLICLKDSNKKSRDGAMDILKYFIQSLHAEDVMKVLFHTLTSGTSTEHNTSIIRSSTTTGLCLLILHHRDNQSILNKAVELLPVIGNMLVDDCPHETKAVLSYIRVFVATQPKETIYDLLPNIVASFTNSLGTHKAKFASRCRAIMRKLVHRLGEDALRPFVPQTDIPLLDYVCKYARKAQRKKDEQKGNQLKTDDQMLGSDSDDDDDDSNNNEGEEDYSQPTAATMKIDRYHNSSIVTSYQEDYRLGARPKANRAVDGGMQGTTTHSWLPSSLEDLLEDQPSTLRQAANTAAILSANTMNRNRTNSVLGYKRGRSDNIQDNNNNYLHHQTSLSNTNNNSNIMLIDEKDPYQVIVNADGKVVVKEIEIPIDPTTNEKQSDDTMKRSMNKENNDDDDQKNQLSKKQEDQHKKRKLNLKEPGIEYRSKKSGGDVWKKGMLEPHAFIALDPRLLSKKHKNEAIDHFGIVVKRKDGKNKRKNNMITANAVYNKNNKKKGMNKSKKNYRKS